MKNDSKNFYPKKIEEVEREFQSLRQEVIADLDAKMKLEQKELEDDYSKEKAKLNEEIIKVMKESGIDVDKINRIDDKAEKNLDAYLSRVTAKFTKKKVDPDILHRENVVRQYYYNRIGCIQPVSLGADLLASNKETLEPNEKASGTGNPAQLFDDPSDIRDIKVSQWGKRHQDPCGYAVFSNSKYVNWYKAFHPPETGLYWFVVTLPYQGYYILNSNDNKWWCRYAKVDVSASVDVHQYFWHGERYHKIFHRFIRNDTEAAYVPGSNIRWSFNEHLLQTDTVYIKLTFALGAGAKGKGSHALVDFDTGISNKVGNPVIYVRFMF